MRTFSCVSFHFLICHPSVLSVFSVFKWHLYVSHKVKHVFNLWQLRKISLVFLSLKVLVCQVTCYIAEDQLFQWTEKVRLYSRTMSMALWWNWVVMQRNSGHFSGWSQWWRWCCVSLSLVGVWLSAAQTAECDGAVRQLCGWVQDSRLCVQ